MSEETKSCAIPPAGWTCSRVAGHDGPCAASPAPSSAWASPTLGKAYDAIDQLRRDLAQPSESGIDESLRRAMEAIEYADLELTGLAA